MGKMRLFREVLWAGGSGDKELLVGLVMVIVLWLFPWITATGWSITLFDHYVSYGKTWKCLNLMVRLGQPDAAAGFLIALIVLPLAMFLVFMNKPVISGMLFITSGALLIYVFRALQATDLLFYLIREWSGVFYFSPPYHIGISTYATIVAGCLLFLSHIHHRRSMQKMEMQKENTERIRQPYSVFARNFPFIFLNVADVINVFHLVPNTKF